MKTRLFRVKAFSVLAVVAMAVTFAFTSCSNNDDPTLGSGGASLTEVDGNFVVKVTGLFDTSRYAIFTIPATSSNKKIDLNASDVAWKVIGTGLEGNSVNNRFEMGSYVLINKKDSKNIYVKALLKRVNSKEEYFYEGKITN